MRNLRIAVHNDRVFIAGLLTSLLGVTPLPEHTTAVEPPTPPEVLFIDRGPSERPRTAAAWQASLTQTDSTLASLSQLLDTEPAVVSRPRTAAGQPLPKPGTASVRQLTEAASV